MFLLVYNGDHNHMHIFISLETSVLNPDLEISGGGGGGGWGVGVGAANIQTLREGGAVSRKKFSVWSKNRGGAGPPGPSRGPGSATKPSCLIGNDLRLTQFHSRGDKIKFSVVKFDI